MVDLDLRARARMAGPAATDGRKAVTELIGRSRFLDQRGANALAKRLQTLLELLRGQLQADPRKALDLADHALHRLIALYAQSDDSGGALGDVLCEVGDLYAQAARSLPDLDGFAKAWLKLWLADDWGLIGSVDVYAATLGRAGLAWLEAETNKRLSALPPARAHGYVPWSKESTMRRRLLALLEQLAVHGGDVDALLTLREQASLCEPDDYIDLSRLCSTHGRARLAIQWLERGVQAFPRDTSLLGWLAQARVEDGFEEEALDLAWRSFQLEPYGPHFLALRDRAGAEAWPVWRERALTHARAQADPGPAADDLLVSLYLAAHDIEAIVALLPRARLPAPRWAELVPLLSADHPILALGASRLVLEDALALGNRPGYERGIDWLRRMQALYAQIGDTDGFAARLAQLRDDYRRKRSFMAMLEDAFPQES